MTKQPLPSFTSLNFNTIATIHAPTGNKSAGSAARVRWSFSWNAAANKSQQSRKPSTTEYSLCCGATSGDQLAVKGVRITVLVRTSQLIV